MLTNGTPMFCAGDEFLITRRGNNNPYNQDNDINYLDWDLLANESRCLPFLSGHDRFSQEAPFDRAQPVLARRHPLVWRRSACRLLTGWPDTGVLPSWRKPERRRYLCDDQRQRSRGSLSRSGRQARDWLLVADTSLPGPQDFVFPPDRRSLTSLDYAVGPHSVVVLYRPLM